MAQKQTEIPTKQIINIGLLIAGFLVVKKVLEKIGVLQTATEIQQQQSAENLETASTTTASTVDPKNPALALNPSYWKAILTKINAGRKLTGKPNLTSTQIAALLKNDPGSKVDYVKQADNIMVQIFASKSLFNDDESQLYNAFQKIRSQLILSFVALRFSTKHNKDLWNYVKEFTNDAEQAKIFNILKSKPLI